MKIIHERETKKIKKQKKTRKQTKPERTREDRSYSQSVRNK